MTLSECFNQFVAFEEEHGLVEWQLDGGYAWTGTRTSIFYSLLDKLAVMGPAQPDQEKKHRQPLPARILHRLQTMRYSSRFAPRSPVLFLGTFNRRLQPDGTWSDIYCDPIRRQFPGMIEIELPRPRGTLRPVTLPGVYYMNDLCWRAWHMHRPKQLPLTDAEQQRIAEIDRQFQSVFGCDANVTGRLHSRVMDRRMSCDLYRQFFRRCGARVLVIVTSYGQDIWTEAAHLEGMQVIELQHGTISPYSTGYSYPRTAKPGLVRPDILLTFGDYWNLDVVLPGCRKIAAGYPVLENKLKQLAGCPRKRQVLFISQGSIGPMLAPLAAAFARLRPDVPIVYKLHQGEVRTWRERYPDLSAPNITVQEDSFPSIHELQMESALQVGVYSTAVFEGLHLGCRTAIAALPGHEHLSEVIANGDAVLVKTAEDLCSVPVVPESVKTNAVYFLSGAEETIRRVIEGELRERGGC